MMGERVVSRDAWGATLLELLVVLTVLALVLCVSGLAMAALQAPREAAPIIELRLARMEAIHSGTARNWQHIRFLPDGRAIGSGVDPLIGAAVAK